MVMSVDLARWSARPTGLDLKLRRIASGVSQRELAQRMGVSPQRLAAVEASYRPSSAMGARVAAALEQDPSLDPRQILGTRRPTRRTSGKPTR